MCLKIKSNFLKKNSSKFNSRNSITFSSDKAEEILRRQFYIFIFKEIEKSRKIFYRVVGKRRI